MKRLLLLMMLVSTVTFAREIQFLSPRQGEKIKKALVIHIQPPRHDRIDIDVWIEESKRDGKILWSGRLNKRNGYITKINTSKFKRGRYVVVAEYRMGRDRFGDYVEFLVD